jgi:SAM-dependent methyltransferase
VTKRSERYSSNVWKILVCPYCRHSLESVGPRQNAKCPGCRTRYRRDNRYGSLDLRLKRAKKVRLEFELGASPLSARALDFKPLTKRSVPEVDFSDLEVPVHLTRELLSHFPKAEGKDSLVLDLGCGNAVHREVCEHAGFEYLGLDYYAPRAPILGDAHSLPFKDESFEFILSVAVLEHIQFPFVVMNEARRVLKPHGKFIGTVAFIEPFHSESFYNHTHLGTLNSLQYGGFEVEHIGPEEEWSGLVALASMGLFPGMPFSLAKLAVLPLQTFHKLWWRVSRSLGSKATAQSRLLTTTGGFTFIASKGPGETGGGGLAQRSERVEFEGGKIKG